MCADGKVVDQSQFLCNKSTLKQHTRRGIKENRLVPTMSKPPVILELQNQETEQSNGCDNQKERDGEEMRANIHPEQLRWSILCFLLCERHVMSPFTPVRSATMASKREVEFKPAGQVRTNEAKPQENRPLKAATTIGLSEGWLSGSTESILGSALNSRSSWAASGQNLEPSMVASRAAKWG